MCVALRKYQAMVLAPSRSHKYACWSVHHTACLPSLPELSMCREARPHPFTAFACHGNRQQRTRIEASAPGGWQQHTKPKGTAARSTQKPRVCKALHQLIQLAGGDSAQCMHGCMFVWVMASKPARTTCYKRRTVVLLRETHAKCGVILLKAHMPTTGQHALCGKHMSSAMSAWQSSHISSW